MRLFVDIFFCFQAEDGIRDLVRSRGLGDVYKRQIHHIVAMCDFCEHGLHVFGTFLSCKVGHGSPESWPIINAESSLYLSLIHI